MATVSVLPSRNLVYVDLIVNEVPDSGSAVSNKSTIEWSLVLRRGTVSWDTSWSGWGSYMYATIDIDGLGTQTIYTPRYNYNGYNKPGSVFGSGSFEVTHDADGSKTINFGVSFTDTANGKNSKGNYYTPGNASRKTGSLTLTKYERGMYVECWENSKTPNSINVGWQSGDYADYVWYSKDGGSNWTAVGSVNTVGGSFDIPNLSADTTYSIKVRARRRDTGIDTNYSPAVSMKTYKAYSYVTSCTVGNIMPFTCTAYCTSSNASNTSAYEYTLCNSNKQAITTVSSSTTSQNWSGLSEETTYYMRCRVQSSDSGAWSDYVYSSAFTTLVDQAKGYIKYGGSWHLGKVYMKINGTWTKAKKAYLKSGGTWTISRNP